MRRAPIGWIAVSAFASVVAVAAAVLAIEAPPVPRACVGAVTIEVRDGVAACVHASERPPAGVDLHRRPTSDELKERRFGRDKKAPEVAGTESGPEVAATGGSVACVGDGTDGMRVQPIYARASDVADRFGSVAGMISQYAADADYQINVSAGVSGQGRRVRYVTSLDCVLSIARVTLSSTGDDSFSAMRQQLQAQGYNRSDRKYLVWMDASVGICGLGELYADDSAAATNVNNRGPAYARVDAPCWGYAEAHELLHTLGAVQDSAPHSSGAGHCVDENDTMCYVDTSGSPMTNACPSQPSWQVDCSLDDYFNAASDRTGYLATHWDVADSAFLEGGPPPPPPPTITASVPSRFYAGNAVAVRASVTVPAGRTYTVRWVSSRSDCKFFTASALSNTYYCPVTAAGGGQVTAQVTDSLGMRSSASRTYSLTRPSRRRATIASLRSSTTSIRRGSSVRLTGKLVDASTGKAIIGMRVTIYYRRAGASSWSTLTTRTTGRTGRFSLTVRPSRTTTYMLVSWYTSTWASDRSNTRRISVS